MRGKVLYWVGRNTRYGSSPLYLFNETQIRRICIEKIQGEKDEITE